MPTNMSGFSLGGFPPYPDSLAEQPAVLVGLTALRNVQISEDSKGAM